MKFVVRQRTGRVVAGRCVALALGLAGWLVGCEPARPDGAYDAANYDIKLNSTTPVDDGGAAVEVEASIPIGGGAGGSVGGSPGGSPAGTAGGTAGGQPGGQPGATQGGAGGTDAGAGGTTGAMVDPEVARLQKLAGHYYMRMDMHSTASANVRLLGTVRTTNLTSHLLVTQLYVKDGSLTSVEQLCYQTFAHRCDQTCSKLTTVMRNEVKNELLKLQPLRTYVVGEGGLSLRGEAQTMYLGFDATSNPALPNNTSDARVWLNGTGNSAREGMWLYLDTTAGVLMTNVKCEVYTAQKFVSAFDGTLKGTAQEPVLDGMSATLDTTGTEGRTLGASESTCENDGGGSTMNGAQTVRFARASVAAGEASETAFWGCPAASVWDELLPAPPL